jgi:hypothetical protein
MKNPVESGTTVNSDSRENPIYEVTCGVPSEFTDAELEKCIAIVKAGDAVVPGSVARDLPRAKVIAVARKDSEIVGVGTIKPIRLDYARGIAGPKKSGWHFDPRVPELGYVAIDGQHRRHGLSERIVAKLLCHEKQLFATTSNEFMKRTLRESKFVSKGGEWRGRRGDLLSLWIKE